MESRWLSRVDFAEVAEAVGVSTSDIMAALVDPDRHGQVFVLYTKGIEALAPAEVADATVYIQRLVRDESGILDDQGRPELVSGSCQDIIDRIDKNMSLLEALREMEGEPDANDA